VSIISREGQFEEKQREAGLGSCGAITLAEARAKAAEYRLLLSNGVSRPPNRQTCRPGSPCA
jgi:hypothetical protein